MLSAVVKFCIPNRKDGINGINENTHSMGRGHLLNLEVDPDAPSLLDGFIIKKSTFLIWSHPTKPVLGSDGYLT